MIYDIFDIWMNIITNLGSYLSDEEGTVSVSKVSLLQSPPHVHRDVYQLLRSLVVLDLLSLALGLQIIFKNIFKIIFYLQGRHGEIDRGEG